jgi:putative endonuclease
MLLRAIMHPMHEGSYFTYIVASRSHTLYIGVTGDLRKRIFEHKWKELDGFSSKYDCDRLVWFESHQNVTAAIAREKQLKGWRREEKIALIEKMNPTWIDLSKDWYDVEPADFKRATDPMRT